MPDSHRCFLHYYFNEVDAGDEVYVIYCDGAVIGVFKTSDYLLQNRSAACPEVRRDLDWGMDNNGITIVLFK